MPYSHNRAKPNQSGQGDSTGNHRISQKLRQAARYVAVLLR